MAGSFVGTTITIDEPTYTEPQIPARWIGSSSASFQTWLTSSCLQLNPTGSYILSALAAKPHQFRSRKMSVVPHHCSLDGRVTRTQWDQPPATPPSHAAGRCAEEARILRSVVTEVWSQPHAHVPAWVHSMCCKEETLLFLTSENEDFVSTFFLFPSDKASDKSLPQHLGHNSPPSSEVVSDILFPFIPAYTVRWLFSTGRRLSMCHLTAPS